MELVTLATYVRESNGQPHRRQRRRREGAAEKETAVNPHEPNPADDELIATVLVEIEDSIDALRRARNLLRPPTYPQADPQGAERVPQ